MNSERPIWNIIWSFNLTSERTMRNVPVVEPMSFKLNFPSSKHFISQCLLETKLSEITISFEAECLPR